MSAGPTPEQAAPRRLSMSRIVELLLTRTSGERSSVSLTRNAKGETQIEVLVRTSDEGDVRTAEDAAAVARRLYEDLCAAYPAGSGYVRNEGQGKAPDA